MLLCLRGLVTEALKYTIPQVAGILWVFLPVRQCYFFNFVDVHVTPLNSFAGNIRKQYNVDVCIWKINLSNNLFLYLQQRHKYVSDLKAKRLQNLINVLINICSS